MPKIHNNNNDNINDDNIEENKKRIIRKGKERKKITFIDNKFKLDDEAEIIYYENFINDTFHDELYEELLRDVPWTQGIYKMYGKSIPTPRLLYCMRDDDFDVTQSYKVTGSMPWTKNMK